MAGAHTSPAPRRVRVGGLLLLLGLVVPRAQAAGQILPSVSQEAELRSAFVYRFTQFVEWPADSPARTAPTVDLCVVGDEALANALNSSVRGKTLGDRPYRVRRPAATENLGGCAVVYVSESTTAAARAALSRIQTSPVLTVSDDEDFGRTGGMIRLFREDDRLRFEINTDATHDAGLRLSSRLLDLARVVHGRSGKPR